MLDKRFPGPESIVRSVLPNGITLLLYENPASATVVMEGLLRAGSLYDPPGLAGLSDFTSDLLMRGTARRDFDAVYDALESVGAALSFGSGRHTLQFSSHSLVEDLDLVLDLLGEALLRPTFPDDQVEQVRGQVLTGLQMRAFDTGRMANLRFMETAYAGHPYGRSVRGYPETVEALTRDDLVAFHGQQFGPRGMVVSVVGAVRAAEMLDRLEALLGGWTNDAQQPEPPVALPLPRPSEPQRVTTVIPQKEQADIVLGLPGPPRSAPDYLHLSLANTVLGVFGMMGRIGESVREEQGLAYYASSSLSGALGPTPWRASAGVAPENIEQAIGSILAEVARIQREPVPVDELDDSKAYRAGSLPVSLETNSALADSILDMELYGLGLDYLQRFASEITAVTVDDVQAAAQKYLRLEEMVISVAGPDVAG